MLRIDPKFSSFNSRYLNRLRTALIFGVLFSACGTTTPPLEVTAELPKNETPPTIQVHAGFYLWEEGSAFIDPSLTIRIDGAYSEATTVVTLDPQNNSCGAAPELTTDTTVGPGDQFARPCYTGEYWGPPITYSVFDVTQFDLTIDNVWVNVPRDVTSPLDGVQIFASLKMTMTSPASATVPTLIMPILYPGSAEIASQQLITQETTLEILPFSSVGTTAVEIPTFVPSSLCMSGPYYRSHIFVNQNSLNLELGDGGFYDCGGASGYGFSVFIRGKLRPAPKPDNLSMVCTPGKGCEFSP